MSASGQLQAAAGESAGLALRGGVPRPQPSYVDHPAFSGSTEFARIGNEAKAAVVQASTRKAYGPNEFIYLQDDAAESLNFVRSGHVRLSYLMEDGAAVLFGILPAGETFGELGIFEEGPHSDMATAVGNVTVTSIPARSFRLLAQRFPELDVALGRIVARRYRSYIALTRSLGLKTLPARLSQALLRLADGLGARTTHKGREVAYVGAFVTQTDLGLMARGARGNVNRALKAWERAGWVAIVDRRVLILDRARLESLALEEGL